MVPQQVVQKNALIVIQDHVETMVFVEKVGPCIIANVPKDTVEKIAANVRKIYNK